MGNKNSLKSEFEQKNWRQLSQGDDKFILYNDLTKKTVEKHCYALEDQSVDPVEICKWRQNLPVQSCVTQLYQYGIKGKGLCNGRSQIYVIAERVFPLNQITKISKTQAFILIRDVARAIQLLINKFNFFSPQPPMIGVNPDGRGRMWIHSNSARMTPLEDDLPIQQSQLVVMNNVIRLIKSKTYNQAQFPVQYPFNLDFRSAATYIDQVFQTFGNYSVDRIYLDRTQFNKAKENIARKRDYEVKSRIVFEQNTKKWEQLQKLHQNLKRQQMDMMQKQRMMEMRMKNRQIVEPTSGVSVFDQPTQMTRHVNSYQNTHQQMMHRNQTNNGNNGWPITTTNNGYNHNNRHTQHHPTLPNQPNQPNSVLPNSYSAINHRQQMPITPANNHQQTHGFNQSRAAQRAAEQKILDSPASQKNVLSPHNRFPSDNIEMVDSMVVIGDQNIQERNRRLDMRPLNSH